MRELTRRAMVCVMLALTSGSLRSQQVRRDPDGQTRLTRPPTLVMAVNTTAVPSYTCSESGCELASVVLVRVIGIPESGALLDSADQAAYTANVLQRVDVSWQFRIASATEDALSYTVSTDSVQHIFRYDPRRDFGETATLPNLIYARAEIRDSAFLAALATGESMTVLTNNPSAGSRIEQHIWLQGANRWMRRVQRAQHQRAAASRVTPTERPDRGADRP